MVIPKLILIPVTALIVAQAIKFIITAIKGEWRWSVLQEYGGMPSAHTAFVVSLTTVIWRQEGWLSPSFALAAVFSLIIIRDAIGFRQFLCEHGRTLNLLVKELPNQADRKFSPRMVEQLGHTPIQATIGGLLGFILGWWLYSIITATW